ncbi:unnamed protein product [Chrysoparadoxa australica]
MVPWWDDWGVRHAATVLQVMHLSHHSCQALLFPSSLSMWSALPNQVDRCQVVQVKTDEANGYTGMQLGVGKAKLKNVSKSKLGHHTKVGVEPKDKLWEFRCSEDGLLPAGTVLRAQHFVPGQNVDVAGITKGKGFQGVMKRHGFGGQPASHGNSKAHRKPGGIGACQDPGRVWKGKKMPGRMGGNRRTIENLQVLQIDTERELLYIKGALPGPKGRFLRVRDSYKKPNFPEAPPFPTYIDDGSEDTPKILKAKLGPVDPMDDSELLS